MTIAIYRRTRNWEFHSALRLMRVWIGEECNERYSFWQSEAIAFASR